MSQKDGEFSKLRSFFWPIHKRELIKFLPMMALFFFISFNYHLLKITKDALIITAEGAGAEVIPFLKVWAILPSAVFMTFIFTKLSNRLTRERIFYVIISIFLIFFLIFITFLYPNRESLHLNRFANFLQTLLPKGLSGLIAIIRYWTYSLFYIMSESWSTIVVSLLLWGFANDVTKISEAKRFYALFGIGINSAGIFAGKLASKISSTPLKTPLFKGFNQWDLSLTVLISIILFFGMLSIIVYRFLHKKIFKERASTIKTDTPKKKMSLKKNILLISKSKYLLSIAVLVLSYNIVINFTEVLWKSQIKELCPSPSQYTNYMSKITFFIGIVATTASYFFSGNFIRRFGWKKTALLTPLIIITTGIGFFYFLLLKNNLPNIYIFSMTPLALCVFFGSAQNILSRAAKYTVFDDTKEMAFIPLSPQERLEGKSAIDGIGSRLGKSGSSLAIQFMLMVFATPIATAPVILGLILFVLPFWIGSINFIEKGFKVKEKEPSL